MTLILAALTVICFLPFFLLYLNSVMSGPGHLIHISHHFGRTAFIAISILLAAVSIALFQQLTYLIPLRIPFVLRCLLSVAAFIAITHFQGNLAWIIPALLLSFILAVFALHFTRPSVDDHDLDRYCSLLRRAHSTIPARNRR
jgi:hypothetical protein